MHPMTRLRLHLVSDSTGETLEATAKAALARFDDVEPARHFWPMVRTIAHVERVLEDLARHPGMVLFTLVDPALRARLEAGVAQLGLAAISPLDSVVDAMAGVLGQATLARPGRQHDLTDAYFARVEAIQYTVAHDDGLNWEGWRDADIILAGVSRTSKTPTSIYLANRGYKTANIPIVAEAPPPDLLFKLKKPLIVGLVTNLDRLLSVRRNRLLSIAQPTQSPYVDPDSVQRELAYARRMFADNDWPIIDVTRRSIEETASAVIALMGARA